MADACNTCKPYGTCPPMVDDRTPFPAHTPVAMAYVPYQNMTEVYEPEHALQVGTIFPELDKPFPGKCNMNIMQGGRRR